jgi:hypothetical protein
MAFVYGTRLPDKGSVASVSNQLLKQKQAEANQRREDRKAFGKAIEKRQEQYAVDRYKKDLRYGA